MAWDTSGSLPLLLYDGTTYYLYGPDGVPFEQITAEVPTYLHHDQQGSTRLLTNGTGETKGTYTYTPYGATEGHTGTATTQLGYGGQYTSKDTGLIYLRARVYDPVTAQFMSVDPLVGTTDAPYFYAGNSPVNGGDPSGLQDPPTSYGVWPIFEHGFGLAGNYQGSTSLGSYGLSGWADIRGWWHVAGSSQGSTAIGNYNVSGYAGSEGWHFNGNANGSTPFGTYNIFGWADPTGWRVNGTVQGDTALGSYGIFGWADPTGWGVNGSVQGSLFGGSYNVSGFAQPDRWRFNGTVQGSTPIGNYGISGWAGNEGYGVGGSLSGANRYGSYGVFGGSGQGGWSLGIWAAFHW
jgi:RHS repeat-associated protein